jgi:hypothetical protein
MKYYWTAFNTSSGEIIQKGKGFGSVEEAFENARMEARKWLPSGWMETRDQPLVFDVVVEVSTDPRYISGVSEDTSSLVATRVLFPKGHSPTRLREMEFALGDTLKPGEMGPGEELGPWDKLPRWEVDQWDWKDEI